MVSRALIKTVDTDFVVTAIAHFLDQEIDELWVEFGAGKKKRWLLFHVYAQHLGKQKCLALLFWCAFTGWTLFPVSVVAGKKLLGMCGKHFQK